MENKKLRKFKLVDKEGYFAANIHNESIFYNELKEGLFEGYVDDGGCLTNSDAGDLITPEEFKFFEEVFDEGGKMIMDTVKVTDINTSNHKHCNGTGSNKTNQVDLEFDYDLIEKIGATHYHKESENLYKMDGVCVCCYNKVGNYWFPSRNPIEDLKENLLPIPERLSVQVGDVCEIQTLKGDFNCKILGFYKDPTDLEFVWVEKLKPSEHEEPFKTYQLNTVVFKPAKPKTWQEVLCEEFDIDLDEHNYTFKCLRGFTQSGLIRFAKRIIELNGE